MKKSTFVKTLAAASVCGLLFTQGAAQAATATTTFTVSANITNSCTVSAANVGFGPVNAGAAAANSASNVTVTCNKGVTATSVALDNGANASGTTKQMANGTERLTYNIDKPTGAAFDTCPTAGSSEWNATNVVAATPLFTTTGGPKTIKICASIPSGQYPAGGAYLDTVTVTVTYT